MIPVETRYAVNAGSSIAYQVVGEGSQDLVMIPAFVSNLEVQWEIPPIRRFLERLASFSRLIIMDKRGTGLSDRVPVDQLPSLEERVSDVVAVMDAAGVDRATLFGVAEGGAMGVLLAADHPKRVNGLVLFGSYAKKERAAGQLDQLSAFVKRIEENWGTGSVFAERSQSVADDPVMKSLLARYERHAASPQAAAAIVRMGATIDVTAALGSVNAPTLVLHRRGDPNIKISGARALADGIGDARLIELPGVDHMPFFGDTDQLLCELEEFVTGTRPEPEPDRLLATVLFIDIAGSTEIVGQIGDHRWRDLLSSFFATTRSSLSHHAGTEVDTAGDGLFATFRSPTQAIRCACDIRDSVGELGISIRAGVHAGEVERQGQKIAGLAVHIGARVAAAATAGEVWVSRTVRDLVTGSSIALGDRGLHQLKGVSESWRLYVVED